MTSPPPIHLWTAPVAGDWPALAPPPRAWDPALTAAILPGRARERLALPGAVVVTTGQQPGLFGGPMYSLHKAIAAAALAAALERRWGRPVVPVFWLAGDDHDWAEATRTAWWGGDETVVTWALPAREAASPQRAMRDEPLPLDEVRAARDHLAADLPAGMARDETLSWIDRHWHAGATIHSAYATGLAELLERIGVAALDATHPAVKAAQRPLIEAALRQSDELDGVLAVLPAAGTGIAAGDRATLVFLDAAAGRDRLIRNDDGVVTRRGGEHFSDAAILELLMANPERFSANVLLRPVVEAALLPTAAYVAGPGELRYLTAQAAALYPLLGVAPQAPVPRWGGAVIDAVSQRLLDRLDLEPGEVVADDGDLGRTILHRDFPATAAHALADLGDSIDRAGAILREAGTAIDPVLDRAVAHRLTRLTAERDALQKVLERHHRRRVDTAWAQYQRLRRRLRPNDAPQERIIGIAGMLGRVGWGWLDAAQAAAAAWADARLAEAQA
jgi:bacillithiol biosynthesis cysteine-adding enzyme BshC